MAFDLVLSSGYLAFARHLGFLQAVEELGVEVEGVCGTSSGALIGALWAAGMPLAEQERQITAQRPLTLLRPSPTPWRGLCTIGPLLTRLRGWLPARFEELPRPLAVGVVGPDGQHRLLSRGPLPEAVAASCAIPYLFKPVPVDGVNYADGGAADRLGLEAWRALRGERELVVHLVDRSHGPAGDDALDGLRVVRSARSGAGFWSLGDVARQRDESRRAALGVLGAALGI